MLEFYYHSQTDGQNEEEIQLFGYLSKLCASEQGSVGIVIYRGMCSCMVLVFLRVSALNSELRNSSYDIFSFSHFFCSLTQC